MPGPENRVNLSPLERALSLAVGVLGAAAAARRRTVPAALLGAVGGVLIYRGVTGRSRLYRLLGISGSEVGSTVSACSQITVQLPATEVYDRLRDLSALGSFSNYIASTREVAEDRWRVWLRPPHEGTLEIRRTADEPDLRLAWCTVDGSQFPAALELRLGDGRAGTEVHADVWLVPPAPPVVTAALRRAERSRPLRRAGLAPSQLLEQELRRLRQLLEAGETATVDGQSAGGRRSRKATSYSDGRLEVSAGTDR